ncbi:TetR/AcrR family transcriptional regulator [Nocardioides immobilis]|uniref:TetR/AcrR family transcriptional regulator n=1 Tax=Nocardioides immobilis TaxID=2049295 RepID=A0A417XST4_9ACTN|nr:TetR/AcrR family transcriptional regulator [Nocardioides immobilis]RHW23376.1 TetR/AcrR family transcriptional regulator [Nocardioides immobilis]
MNGTEQRIRSAAIRLFAERGSADVTISDLATEAGVARGTLYRNVGSIESLYERVRLDLAAAIHVQNVQVMDAAGITDPPARLATGTRLLVRMAHDDPSFGRFMVRFGLADETLREILSGPPMQDLAKGIAAGRYAVPPGSELSIASMLMGTVIGAMWMVLEGHQGWREAGAGAAELVLRSLGVAGDEAKELVSVPLPEGTAG